jgi:hypothetical protein
MPPRPWSVQAANYVINGSSNVPGLAPFQIGNDSLKWETLKQADVGLEVGLFKERLQFTVDYYNKITITCCWQGRWWAVRVLRRQPEHRGNFEHRLGILGNGHGVRHKGFCVDDQLQYFL